MASAFELIPAIDLRDRHVVRLEQGDFARETVFSADPVAAARGFVAAGAAWLHVVDLDGARAGEPAQLDVVRAIAAGVGDSVAVEAAGGIRSADAVSAAIDAGARRVAFGTAAIRDPGLVAAAIARHGRAAVTVAIDVRAGDAVGDAWQAGATGAPVADLVTSLADIGVEVFEVTAVDRDGLLGGPDLTLLGQVVGLGVGGVIASGGIRGVDDLLAVRDLGCTGAIVGRALYDDRFDLRTAIEAITER